MYLTYTGFSNFNRYILKFDNDPEQIHEKNLSEKLWCWRAVLWDCAKIFRNNRFGILQFRSQIQTQEIYIKNEYIFSYTHHVVLFFGTTPLY